MLADLLSTLLRGLGFIAALQAGGAALFLVLSRSLEASRAGIVRLARRATLVAALLLVAQYVLEAARLAGTLSGALDPALQRMALHGPAAPVAVVRLAGLALLAWGLRGGRGSPPLQIAGAFTIAVSFTLIGHTTGSPMRGLLAPLLLVHLLAAQFWFGALVPLLRVGRSEDIPRAAQVVERFSRQAMWLVPLIAVAGVLLAAGLLPDVAALRGPYGIGLLGKAALFALLMALAAWNKWRLTPALATQGPVAVRRLERSIRVEYALLALLLMGTAFLTTFWSPEH